MDNKKQMYLRLLFNKSFSKQIPVSMHSTLEDHIDGTIINVAGQADCFDIFTKDDPIYKENYDCIISVIIVDFVKRNYIHFKNMYEEYAYNDKQFKENVSKEDIQIFMNTETNKFLFNLNIFKNCLRVTFR